MRLWLILAVVLVVCVCAAGVSATNIEFSLGWDELYAEQEARSEEWLLECPEEERIILRSPIDGEATWLFIGDGSAYISKEDVRAVVRQVLAEEELPGLTVVVGGSPPRDKFDTAAEMMRMEGCAEKAVGKSMEGLRYPPTEEAK